MTLGIERAKEVDDRRVMRQVERLARIAQQHQREEEEGYTEEEITDIAATLTVNKHDA